MSAERPRAAPVDDTAPPRPGQRLTRRAARWAIDYTPAVAFLVALVGLWEAWVRLADVRPFIMPPPSSIYEAFLAQRGNLAGHFETTVLEAVYGLAAAAAVGVALSVVLVTIPFARRVLFPLLVVSQNIPLIVLAPLLAVWFGLGLTPKVVLVALVGFFPIVVSTTDGLLRADREMIELVRSMGANRAQVLRHVLIPGALPSFFAGLKISATYAVLAAVFAEWMGAQSGLGLFILRSDNAFRTDQVFLGVVAVALTSIALFAFVNIAARLIAPWMYINEQEGNP